MDNTNSRPIPTPNLSANWRVELNGQERFGLIRNLARSLKHLSPHTDDNSIFTTARNFEHSIYLQSSNKTQYILAYAGKYNQIKYQIENTVTTGGGGNGITNLSAAMAPQPTQASISPQLQMVQQQSQNTSNALSHTQQIQSSCIRNNQQYLNKQQNQQQQQPTMNQSLTSPITSMMQQQQKQQQQLQLQLQIFLAQQRLLQQRQQQQQQQQQQQSSQSTTTIQPVMNNIQQRQQTSNLISAQQRIQATIIVRQLDENIRTNRARKKTICETVMQMRPLYEKIGHLLPIFLALTSNCEATRRLIIMKYIFEDQLNALPQNVYLITLERLRQIREQFSAVFAWIRNTVNGDSLKSPQSQPQQPLRQQTNHQLPPISHTETSTNTTTPSPSMPHSSNSSFIKREITDLNFPPSKKQRAMTDQPTQQQRESNSATDPALAYCSQPENVWPSIPDCARAVAKTDSPSIDAKIGPTSTESIFDAAQQRLRTVTMPNDSQSQMFYLAALSSKIPANIVAMLPAQALKCSWLLSQDSLNKIKLADPQKARLHRILDGFITQAKERLTGKDHISQQSDAFSSDTSNILKIDQQQLHTTDSALSPLSTSTANNLNFAMGNSPSETTSSQDFQQKMKWETICSSTLSSPATVTETTSVSAFKSSTTNASAEPPITVQPAIITTSPTSDYLRPGAGSEDNATNADTLNNMTNTTPSTETSRAPVFVMDDFNIGCNNNRESYSNNNNNIDISGSHSSIIDCALKEGFKGETLSSAFNNNSLLADQSNNSSSLFSTSPSSSEMNEELVKNNWQQLGISENVVGFISYDSGNRLSHPPLL
ncbi:hypothetical protein BCR42DRAFT_421845 [Absidia repens]|uniref:Mediator complex subunit 15 KIX domain-containing protein n=1 Tax=Absidia repens TaxID=90262 RepID=A0A1X2I6U2_9FUNG|nr:hypothetical protein BCR42DRAFT_421845 [Absidia repens]